MERRMYPALTQTQADRRRASFWRRPAAHGENHFISILRDLDLIEEMTYARMECCSSRSHYFRRLIRRAKERIKAQRQHDEWVQTWGEK